MLETAWESRWLPDPFGGLAQLGERLPCKQEVTSSNLVFSTRYVNKVKISIICTLKTAHRKFSIKRAMQTADDADGGDLFPDIIAEGAGYSATARIERKRERTRDGALRRNVRKRHQISMIRKN